MSDQTMYQWMVAKGIDMSWYTRNRHATDDAIPLYDETCNKSLSVYLLRTDGTLWTVNDSGSPHRKVRDTGKSLEHNIFLCMATKTQYASFGQAREHSNCKQGNN